MKTNYIVWSVIVVVIAGFGFGINKLSNMPGTYDEFTQCLAEKEAVFYGSFYCPHCQDQKSKFGKSKKFLPYVECSTADRQQTQACKDAGIEAYPTWIFADGSKQTGTLELAVLAEKTGCELADNE